MFSRFRIDDLISQDEMSVVYLGVDEKTGQQAALRRFFVGGGSVQGIAEEDREGFSQAFSLLSEVDHPCLRRVIEAGLDDIDGVPFVATEWADGEFLRDVMAEGPLTTEEGELLIRQGLDLAAHLESFFGERAYWMKLHPDSVIVLDGPEGRSFTFSLSLDRWMGVENAEHGLRELATLVESACGLVKKDLLAQESPLQEWIRHVRETDPTVSEARGALDFVMHKEIEPSASAPAIAPVFRTEAPALDVPKPEPVTQEPVLQMSPPLASSSGKGNKVLIGSLLAAILVIGGVVFALKNKSGATSSPVDAVVAVDEKDDESIPVTVVRKEPVDEESPVVLEEELVAEKVPAVVPASEVADTDAAKAFAEKASRSRARIAAIESKTEYQAREGKDIRMKIGKAVTVTGQVVFVRGSSKYIYFEFSQSRGEDDLCFRIRKKNAPDYTDKELHSKYEGKTITAQGMIDTYRAGSINRVYLELESLEDLKN